VAELALKGEAIAYEAMLAQVEARDARDRGRADAPLKPAPDAHLLDTSDLTIDAAVDKARSLVEAVRARLTRP
jgi:cytidylate kinase